MTRGVPGTRATLLRLGAGAAIVGLALLALWQAGLLFDTSDGGDAADAALEPADASVRTPAVSGYEVGLRPGNLAPDFEFSDFEGRRQRLSDYRGRPVALNFWASWCGPCKAEMPALEAAVRRYEARGLAVIGMNNGESLKTAQRFLNEVKVELSAFGYDPQQAVVRRYAIDGMPTTYFIDANGVITRVVTGTLNERILQSAIEEAIIGWGRVQARP
ncbi:MAG TPA: TlpA disulfide reductase family protein [Dehalococcoidia bacterium]|nr:TlpA disulfide reductase family protein [Dehalococcoidia bacterium]